MAALALIFLSPALAEYLSGYDDHTGSPVELLTGLLFLGPLYGCPALLIRETARRRGLGWPSILLMATAFGIIQAGVIDQSFFNGSYRDIDYWQSMWEPTYLGALGLSPALALSFLAGHVIWSYTAPIAIVESISKRRDRPWLRWRGLAVVSVLYVAAAWLINRDHLQNEDDDAALAQWGLSLVIAIVLIVLALQLGRPSRRDVAVPRPLFVFVISFVSAALFQLLPLTWPGFAACVTILTVNGFLLARAGRSVRWSQRHVVAVAAGPVISLALFAFLITPLGDIDPLRKYGHNVLLIVAAGALLTWAAKRASLSKPSTGMIDRHEPR